MNKYHRIQGFYSQPCAIGLELFSPYYALRYNKTFANMSNKPLGWQALVDCIVPNEKRWINIDLGWIATKRYNKNRLKIWIELKKLREVA